MRLLILAFSVIGILASPNVAKADRRVAFVVGNAAYKNVTPLPTPPIDAKAMAGLLRNVGFDVVEGTNQIGLDKGQRRDVQRRLTSLGFDTKVNGTFDEVTRAVIKRWPAARGHISTGFLNRLQHKALQSEIVAAADVGTSDDSDETMPY
jgi:hypothetical protein